MLTSNEVFPWRLECEVTEALSALPSLPDNLTQYKKYTRVRHLVLHGTSHKCGSTMETELGITCVAQPSLTATMLMIFPLSIAATSLTKIYENQFLVKMTQHDLCECLHGMAEVEGTGKLNSPPNHQRNDYAEVAVPPVQCSSIQEPDFLQTAPDTEVQAPETSSKALLIKPIAPVGNLKNIGSAVKLPPISGAGNSIHSGTHIRAHITTQAHLWCNHLEPQYS
ncbi:hypothetical protein E2C01_004595 [Portunus trituberculatus]|uniref:Uncharacterized protein n=1 Tax=Portunus trituberculatus TaxID=210409 RepID=A0A5B7CR47_PORTR|nr:hypothetical protein [Portunus trituberculatus]